MKLYLKRNFLITSHRLKVFEWKGSTLIASFEFEDHEQGLLDFEEYLTSSDNIPTQILLELIEEDFLIVKVPFLRGKERKSMIDRMLKRHYRNAHFSYHQRVRILKGIRKEEEVLFTAITTDDTIDDWMSVIEKNKVSVSSIWSLPILCEELAKKLFPKKQNALLISRQIRSAFRETYIRDGKLILSRIVRLSNEHIITDSSQSYMDHNIIKIRKFLNNKNYMQATDKLFVICLMPDKFIAEAQTHYTNNDEYEYRFFGLTQVQKLLKIKTTAVLHADAIFSYICSTHPIKENPYGDKKSQFQYFVNQLNSVIHRTSFIGSFTLFMAAIILGTMSHNLSIQTKQLQLEHVALKDLYNTQYKPLQTQIDSSEKTQQHILFEQQLRLESQQSLENTFAPLSVILSNPNYSRIQLTDFSWSKLHGAELQKTLKKLDENSPNTTITVKSKPQDYKTYSLKYPTLTINGNLNQKNLSYRETISIMNDFVKQLQSNDIIENLWLIKAPVDTRTFSNFSDQQGLDKDLISRSDSADQFEIMLLLKGTPVSNGAN